MSRPTFSSKRKGKKTDPYPIGTEMPSTSSQTKRSGRGRPRKPKSQHTLYLSPELDEVQVRALFDSDPRVEDYSYHWDRLGPERLVWHVQVTFKGGKKTVDQFVEDYGLDKEIRVESRAKRGQDGELWLEQIDPKIRDVIAELNTLEGVSTTHACSGLHRNARPTHVIIAFDSEEDLKKHQYLLRGFKSRQTHPPGRRKSLRRTVLISPQPGQSDQEFWDQLRGRL